MPIHVPSWLRKSLNPNQIIDAFDHYGEKVIDWVSREGGVLERALITSGVAAARPLAAIADQLTDAGMPAVNLYYGEKYNPFTLKRYRSANPFTQKGGIVKRPPSQLPARGMPAPGYWRPTKRGRADPDDPSRPWKRSRSMPAYRRSKRATGRAWKSKRKKRYVSPKGVTNVYDDHNEFTDPSALYVYAQDHGSTDRAIAIGAQAVLKAVLATIKVYPASMVDSTAVADHQKIVTFLFRRQRGQAPTNEESTAGIVVNGRTFAAMTADFVAVLTPQLANGYLPFGFRFSSQTDPSETAPVYRTLGDSMIYFSARTVLRLQNTTHADGTGNTDMVNTVDANPLKGKVYYTKGTVPYIKDHLVDIDATLLGFHESNEYGINKAYENFTQSTWNHPPAGSAFFKYCNGSRNITMKPGSILPLRSSFSSKMKVTDFFKKVAGAKFPQDGPYYFGKCTVVALEQSMRSNGNEQVDVAINRELTMRASCVLKTRVPTLSSYVSTPVPATV